MSKKGPKGRKGLKGRGRGTGVATKGAEAQKKQDQEPITNNQQPLTSRFVWGVLEDVVECDA